MNMDNLDEEEKARHKQEKIEYRNKKRFSSIFLFIATVFEIIETFLIILLLIIGSVAITTRFVDVNSALFSNILGIIIIVFSLGGLIIGFIIYKKAMGWAIKKFNLQDKLLEDVTSHYIKKMKKRKNLDDWNNWRDGKRS